MGINRCRYLGLDPGFFIGVETSCMPSVQSMSLISSPSDLLNGKRTTLEVSAIKNPGHSRGWFSKDQTLAELSRGGRRPEEQ